MLYFKAIVGFVVGVAIFFAIIIAISLWRPTFENRLIEAYVTTTEAIRGTLRLGDRLKAIDDSTNVTGNCWNYIQADKNEHSTAIVEKSFGKFKVVCPSAYGLNIKIVDLNNT